MEITHFSKISGLSIHDVLVKLKAAGLQAIAGGGAEILSDRVRGELCPKKATADEWLEVARTAHHLGIKTNASMIGEIILDTIRSVDARDRDCECLSLRKETLLKDVYDSVSDKG